MSTDLCVACPHCQADNPSDAQFCEQCGKAMPRVGGGPRVVEGKAVASTRAGQTAQADELAKRARGASTALLAVAILTTLGIGLVYLLVKDALSDPELGGQAKVMLAVQVIVCGIFWGIWYWSRSSPLPAAITGLVLYSTLVAVNVIAALSQGDGPGAGIIDAIIIVVLIRGIQAGVKYRQLKTQMYMNE